MKGLVLSLYGRIDFPTTKPTLLIDKYAIPYNEHYTLD